MNKKESRKEQMLDFIEEEQCYVKPVDDIFAESIFLSDKATNSEDLKNEEIEKYAEYMNNKKILKVRPSAADNHGNLIVPLPKNITGFIPNEEVIGKPYNTKTRSTFIGRDFHVLVTNIDKKTHTVYLSRDKARTHVRNILKTKLKPGTTVRAKVQFVNTVNHRVYIDIEGCGILGYVPISEWSHGYVLNPEKDIHENSVVNVEIIRYMPPRGTRGEVYICSRKKIMPDPWIGIEERYPRNTLMEVIATDLRPDKFYARLAGLELDVYCEYPSPTSFINEDGEEIGTQLIIKKGHTYLIRVYNCSEDKKILRARPIREIIKDVQHGL
ncbi:MAG: hypothetical protein AB7G87_03770 [Clostridia bacterium]